MTWESSKYITVNIYYVRFEPSVKAMYITFQCYKHSTGRPHTIAHARSGNCCPVESLKRYLAYRGNSPGPLRNHYEQVCIPLAASMHICTKRIASE